MVERKSIYRSRDKAIAGVCSGVAKRFDSDALVVRILALILLLPTFGLIGVAYIFLGILLPQDPYEIENPAASLREKSMQEHNEIPCEMNAVSEEEQPRVVSAAQVAGWRYMPPTLDNQELEIMQASVAHTPPVPPATAEVKQPVSAPVLLLPDEPAKEISSQSIRAALWGGSILLFVGAVSAISMLIEDISWWQYWPLIIVILGIVRMVVPGSDGYLMRRFIDGAECFLVGLTLFVLSIGIFAWMSIGNMLSHLWPLLIMAGAFRILGGVLKSPIFIVCEGISFAAFCIFGLAWFSYPGLVQQLVVVIPRGRAYQFDFVPMAPF